MYIHTFLKLLNKENIYRKESKVNPALVDKKLINNLRGRQGL